MVQLEPAHAQRIQKSLESYQATRKNMSIFVSSWNHTVKSEMKEGKQKLWQN